MARFTKPPGELLPHEIPPEVPDDAKMEMLEMTPERKQRIAAACEKIVDILHCETESPLEGMVVLQWVFDGMRDTYGVYFGSLTLKEGEGRPDSVAAVRSMIAEGKKQR